MSGNAQHTALAEQQRLAVALAQRVAALTPEQCAALAEGRVSVTIVPVDEPNADATSGADK